MMNQQVIVELRIAMIVLAPLQWATVIWYVRRLIQYPNAMRRRLIPWVAMIVTNIVVPVTVLHFNWRAENTDLFLMVISLTEGTVFVGLSLYLLSKRSSPH